LVLISWEDESLVCVHLWFAFGGTRNHCDWSSCYSWWLPSPRRLGACDFIEALEKIVRCSVLRRRICEGDCAHPAGITKSNSIGLHVSLSYRTCVWVRSRCLWGGVPREALALGAIYQRNH
jgi:hypothetical protein